MSAKKKAVKATPKAVKPVKAAEATPGLPMFFRKPTVLDARRHATASISPTQDYGFSRGVNSVGVNTIEFIEAAKFYPIVFSGGANTMPAVVLGLDKENSFLSKSGQWQEHAYVPAYVRQYPFIFFENSDDRRFYLCVDEAAPQFHTKKIANASPLFKKDGTSSELSAHALQFCTSFYQHHTITRNFCADLVKHKLLTPYSSEITLTSGKQFKLGGFLMIDEAAFNALPDATLLEFRKKGWLAFIYFALASASNWKRLALMAAPQTK